MCRLICITICALFIGNESLQGITVTPLTDCTLYSTIQSGMISGTAKNYPVAAGTHMELVDEIPSGSPLTGDLLQVTVNEGKWRGMQGFILEESVAPLPTEMSLFFYTNREITTETGSIPKDTCLIFQGTSAISGFGLILRDPKTGTTLICGDLTAVRYGINSTGENRYRISQGYQCIRVIDGTTLLPLAGAGDAAHITNDDGYMYIHTQKNHGQITIVKKGYTSVTIQPKRTASLLYLMPETTEVGKFSDFLSNALTERQHRARPEYQPRPRLTLTSTNPFFTNSILISENGELYLFDEDTIELPQGLYEVFYDDSTGVSPGQHTTCFFRENTDLASSIAASRGLHDTPRLVTNGTLDGNYTLFRYATSSGEEQNAGENPCTLSVRGSGWSLQQGTLVYYGRIIYSGTIQALQITGISDGSSAPTFFMSSITIQFSAERLLDLFTFKPLHINENKQLSRSSQMGTRAGELPFLFADPPDTLYFTATY